MRDAVSYVTGEQPTTVFTAFVGRAAYERFGQPSASSSSVASPVAIFIAAAHAHITSTLGPSAHPVRQVGRGASTQLSFSFPFPCPLAATPFQRSVSHAGHWTFRHNNADVVIAMHVGEPLLPPNHLSLRFLDVLIPLSTVSLPEVVLRMAGYTVYHAHSPSSSSPPGAASTIYILRFRLSSALISPDPSTFLIEVIPPSDDAFLRCLPPSIPPLLVLPPPHQDPRLRGPSSPRLEQPRKSPPPLPT